jgi:hypothetical protein
MIAGVGAAAAAAAGKEKKPSMSPSFFFPSNLRKWKVAFSAYFFPFFLLVYAFSEEKKV